MYLFAHQNFKPFIHSSIHLFIHPSIHSFIYLSIYAFIHLSISSLIHPSIHLFIHPSIYSFIQPFIHQSINPFFILKLISNVHRGETVLEEWNIDYKTDWDLWENIVALIIMTLIVLFLSYVQLRRIPKHK